MSDPHITANRQLPIARRSSCVTVRIMNRKLSSLFAAAGLFTVLIYVSPGLGLAGTGAALLSPPEEKTPPAPPPVTLSRQDHWLVIHAPGVPGKEIKINYLEAYCRGGSTDADWVKHTTVGHQTESLPDTGDGKQIRLRCKVNDGLVVEHDIRAVSDGVTFDLTVTNPTDHANEAQWAQPCIRLGDFAGAETNAPDCQDIKLERAFIFLEGRLTIMPMQPWATEARYKPGQVWCIKDVPRTDVNPRPLSKLVPDNGIIGCFSSDAKWIFAVCFEPAQELFQGVARCLHNDFRIGAVPPGGMKKIRGRIWIMPNDPARLTTRHAEWMKAGNVK